jgi:hypothetical protein
MTSIRWNVALEVSHLQRLEEWVLWYHIQTLLLRPRQDRRSPPKTRAERIDFVARSIFAQRVKDFHQTQLSKRQGDDPCHAFLLGMVMVDDCGRGVASLKFWR